MDEIALKLFLLLALIVGSIQNEAKKPYSFDLTNQIKMETRMDGGPYKEIFSKSGSGYNDLADLIPSIRCDSQFIIAGQLYRVKVNIQKFKNDGYDSILSVITDILFNGGMDNSEYSYHVDIIDPKGQKVITNIIKMEHDSRGWERTINKDNRGETSRGYCLQTFTDPLTGIDCMVESRYEASGSYSEYQDEEKKHTYSSVSIHSEASVKVGFKKFLHGNGAVNENINYGVDVVDWNMDGTFNEQDMAYFDFMCREFTPLEKQTRLAPRDLLAQLFRNKASKYEYLLHLKSLPEKDGKFLLGIERVK